MANRRSVASGRARYLLMALVGVLGLAVVFDESWIRPLVQHYVRSHSGRSIDFSRIAFRLDRHGRPLLRLHDLVLDNVAWAAPEPLIKAGLIEAVFGWATLTGDHVVIERMRLVDASLDLERQADGLRNWRIANPEDRRPGRVRVLALDAERSRLRFVHRGLGLELDLRSAPLPVPVAASPRAELPLTRSIVGAGVRDGLPFEVRFETSDRLTLYDSGIAFRLRGELRTAHTRLELDGSARDLLQLGGLDARMRATGEPKAGLSEIATVARGATGTPAWLPRLASELAAARLRKDGRAWHVEGLTAQVGRSDLAGDADYREPERRAARQGDPTPVSSWHARLTSHRIDLGELRTTSGRAVAREMAMPTPTRGTAPSTALAASAPALAATPKRPPRFDAALEWNVQAVDGVPLGPVTALRFVGSIAAGVWQAPTLAFDVAGGHVSGSVSFDTGTTPGSLTVQAHVDGAALDRLGVKKALGRLNGRVALQSRGDTFTALLAAGQGRINGSLVGASLPSSLDAELGLDGGRWMRSLFDRSGRSAITCSAFDFFVEHGIARVRTLALETDALVLTGAGAIDLPGRRLDLTLTPHRKHFALLALDRSIRLEGAIKKPSIALIDRVDAGPARCVAEPNRG